MISLGFRIAGSRPLPARFAGLFYLTVLLCISVASGQDADTLHGLYHNRWTVREGTPSNIKCIAQAQDGYLWLGTDHGLFRFDGVSFDAYRPASGGDLLSGDIATISTGPHGGLWIGFALGGAGYLKNDRLITYSQQDGLSGEAIQSFAINSEGTVWAASEYGISRLHNSVWHDVGSHRKYPDGYPTRIFFDSRGTLWASTYRGISYLKRDQLAFQVADPHPFQNVSFAETADGSVWMASTKGLVKAISDRDGAYLPQAPELIYRSQGLLADRKGMLWIATDGKGIARIKPERVGRASTTRHFLPQQFTERDGLTGNFAFQAIQDREGSVWVATTKGLDQFRRALFTSVPLPSDATYIAMVLDASGHLLVGTDHFLRVVGEKATVVVGAPPGVECAYLDPHGDIWLGGPRGLGRLRGKHFVSIPLPPALERHPPSVQAMTLDNSDTLWVSFVGTGVFRWANGAWTRPSRAENLPSIPAIVELREPDGRSWFGYTGNRIATVTSGQGTVLTTTEGINVGDVSLISRVDGQIWIGGKVGLEYLKGGRFWDLKMADHDLLHGVSGVVQGQGGDLWVNTILGIRRLPGAEIKQALLDPQQPIHAEKFGYLDGIVGTPEELRPLPTALRATGGRLYFAMRGGIVWLDPNDLTRNLLPPPTLIKSVLVDGRFYGAPRNITLPPNARNVVIDYTANSLLIPQRVHFRHKLDGLDTQWQDAGTQRQAFYSRLPPGKYEFRVIGSNNDGVWSETAASFDFVIPPSFVQSLMFKLLCAASILSLLWLSYVIRLRQVSEHIRSRLLDRMTEREGVARDLHDTFLQGIQGVLLSFHTATKMLQVNERPRAMLENALAQSDKVMLEGRDMVMQLRGQVIETCGLPEAFATVGNAFARDNSATFTLLVIGDSCDVHVFVRDDIYCIGREAVANAFRHAKAKEIEMELTYGPSEFRLRVRDNGTGIDPLVLKAGGRNHHWGMPGMRERADKIGGRLNFWSSVKAGTEMDLRVPGAVAYSSSLKRTRFRRLQEFFGGSKDRDAR